jgi:cytochrome P450
MHSQIAQFCIHRFCKHPEYQQALIKEAKQQEDVAFGSTNKDMPYLDSFLKETARLSPGPIGKAICSRAIHSHH